MTYDDWKTRSDRDEYPELERPEEPEVWRCESCGEEFDEPTTSHAVHSRNCDGNCRSCPEQCGPVSREILGGCPDCGDPEESHELMDEEPEEIPRFYCTGPRCEGGGYPGQWCSKGEAKE